MNAAATTKALKKFIEGRQGQWTVKCEQAAGMVWATVGVFNASTADLQAVWDKLKSLNLAGFDLICNLRRIKERPNGLSQEAADGG